MNEINVIKPYRYGPGWVFDDAEKGLTREAFVAGADSVMDLFADELGGVDTFYLTFSAKNFPSHQYRFDWVGEMNAGNLYRHADTGLTGWLCPALYKYFDETPASIYVSIKKEVAHAA